MTLAGILPKVEKATVRCRSIMTCRGEISHAISFCMFQLHANGLVDNKTTTLGTNVHKGTSLASPGL